MFDNHSYDIDSATTGRIRLLLVVCAILCVPGVLAAQPSSPGSSGDVRSAGGDAQFRVIDRFPKAEKASTDDASEASLESLISRQVIEAMQRGAWHLAERRFSRRIGEVEPSHRFLRGYLAWKSEEWSEASKHFGFAAEHLPVLADYAHFYHAASELERGRYHRAVTLAARVPPKSRLYPDALYVMAKGLSEAGKSSDRERAIRVMKTYVDNFPAGEHASELRLELARSLFAEKSWKKGVEQLFSLLEAHPLSEQAEEADELLEKYESNVSEDQRRKIAERPRELRMARLEALFEAHDSEKLIDEAKPLVEEWTPGGRPRCRGLYWIGRSHTKLRKHGEAATWYERVLDECEGIPPFERKALYLAGKSYWNSGEKKTAIERYKRLWERFESHSFADDAMYFCARIHRELGASGEAVELLEKQVERHPDGDMADDAHWLRVREMFRRDDYERAVAYVDELEETGEDELAVRGRLHYFRARALEKSGEPKEAREAYLEVATDNPLTIYALFAINRIARLDGELDSDNLCVREGRSPCHALRASAAEAAEREFRPTVSDTMRSTAVYRKGSLLLRLGIRSWAKDEFDRLFRQFSSDPNAILGLADLLDRAGARSFAYRLPDRVEGWRDRYPVSEGARVWKISYPKAFERRVAKWADRRDLSQSLVWSIIRKESGFNPTIKSWANARGLMQLMPETAKEVASRIDAGAVDRHDLLDADVNIRLGTAYLKQLSERFDGHPALVIAGYNGGYGNVSRWLERRGDLPLDLWIEDIPYGQTRRYVKVALASDWTYRWLYGEPSVPRISFDVSDVLED